MRFVFPFVFFTEDGREWSQERSPPSWQGLCVCVCSHALPLHYLSRLVALFSLWVIEVCYIRMAAKLALKNACNSRLTGCFLATCLVPRLGPGYLSTSSVATAETNTASGPTVRRPQSCTLHVLQNTWCVVSRGLTHTEGRVWPHVTTWCAGPVCSMHIGCVLPALSPLHCLT